MTMRPSPVVRPRLPSRQSRLLAAGAAWLALALATAPAGAQDAGTDPAFSISSHAIYAPGGDDPPTVSLAFQRVDHLDFRVYKVRDAAAFFAGLSDAHSLGSPAHDVPQEPTTIERIARWKARWRARVTDFFRQQVSSEYRRARRSAARQEAIVQRRTVQYTQFAQVPLLNEGQVVATWRELLPNTRDTEWRTIPLELPSHGVYVVEAVHGHLKAYTVVVVSALGLVTKTAPGQVLLFLVDRQTGAPKGDCAASVIVNREVRAAGATGADGVFAAALPQEESDSLIALARCGEDAVVTDPGAYFLREPSRSLKGYVYTDRPVYRPGHTVHLKAVLRWADEGQPRPFDRQEVEVVVSDPDDKVVLRQQRPVDRFGSVFTSLALPAGAALGDYTVTINTQDQQATGSFAVEEYRKPEFEVAVTAPQRFHLQGTRATLRVRAGYYFGQPVAGGRVKYVTYSTSYWSPWRSLDAEGEDDGFEPGYFGDQESEAEATLDAKGEAEIVVDLPQGRHDGDLSVRVEARVTDATGREVSGRTTVIATRGPFLVASQASRWVYTPGAEAQFRVRVVDYDGRPQANAPVRLSLGMAAEDDFSADPRVKPVASATLSTGDDGQLLWPVTLPAESGRLVMIAEVTADGRTMRSRTYVWVPGAGWGFDAQDRSLELVPDKASYAPGDTARFAVRGADRATAMLVTKEYASTLWHEVRRLEVGQTLDVPIGDADIGDVWVNVAFVSGDALFVAEKRVRVPPVQRQLTVSVEPARAVSRPREPGVFTVRTLDASGQPVSAQLSLGVVDEAVYGVRADATPDPAAFFYRRSYSSVYTGYSRTYSFTGYAGTQALKLAQRRRPLALADFKAERPERPPVRKDFPDAIFWVADLVTDASGTATVQVSYPDSLTTWRVTARAVTEDTRLGAALARTSTTKDVIVRAATPRFLTEGDTVGVPVVAHNYLASSQPFDVSLRGSGVTASAATPSGGLTVTIPAGGEHRSTWEFTAGAVGTATFTGTARTAGDDDGVEVSLPVLPFGLAREEGASGTLTGTAEHTLALPVPDASNPAARSIEVTLAPSMAGSLIGALDYLTGYPYGCTEQTLSSFLPNLTVMRAMSSLGLAPGERVSMANRFAASGLRRLYDYQHEDGGFGWWKADDDDPFMTAYALYGMVEAWDAGMDVDRERLQRAATSTIRQYREYPRMTPDLKAYLAWTLARTEPKGAWLLDEATPAWNAAAVRDELWSARERMGVHGKATLLMTLDLAKDPRAGDLAAALAASAQSRGDLAWWTAGDDPWLADYADTSVEATALAVQALVGRDADNPLLERAVRWLLASRGTGSSWYSTKQTALALYGLLSFMKARQEAPAAFGVDLLVNGEKVASHDFTPADFTAPAPVRLRAPARAGRNDVRLVKRGPGTLYWTAASRYFDTRESASPQGSRQLALSRRYFSLSPVEVQGRIVYRESVFDGQARPGDLLLVRLTVAGTDDWRYLVIEDPLPAGAEPVADQDAYELERPEPWWQFGRGRREYRDTRVVQFQDRLPGGRAEFGYLLKVVTPGRFRAMPAQVLPMYVPGVAASTAVQAVTVAEADAGTAAIPLAPAGGGAR